MAHYQKDKNQNEFDGKLKKIVQKKIKFSDFFQFQHEINLQKLKNYRLQIRRDLFVSWI